MVKSKKKLQRQEQGEITEGSGYYYTDQDSDQKMVEFDVDASNKLLFPGNVTGDVGGIEDMD